MNGQVINSINSKPETIKNFLQNHEYVIPDYQRPYSWGKEECLKLWDDLLAFHEERKPKNDDSYFLGTVVVHNEENKRHVVDGQQRLITLNLLMRALLERCQTYSILEKMLYKRDPKTDKILKDSIRINHKVFGDNENERLETTIKTPNKENKNKYKNNYNEFIIKIDKLDFSANKMENLIENIIDRVLILPIECNSFDAALTIFETINNRGLDLSDADIFKSKLYAFALNEGEKQKEEFINRWDAIHEASENSDLSLQDVFTNYMHILRGESKITDSVVALRKFFGENNNNKLTDWRQILLSIEKIIWGWNYITSDKDNKNSLDIKIVNWANVLLTFTNVWWQYPIMTYLHKNIEGIEGEFFLKKEHLTNLESLLKLIVRYCYLKWLKHRSLTPMKDTIYKLVAKISYREEYQSLIKNDLSEINQKALENILFDNSLGKGKKGMCYLIAILNNTQRSIIPFNKKLHVEHILPKKWGHYKYDGWDETKFNNYYDKIGNLVLLEGKLNIKASHKFFAEKKHCYRKSNIAEANNIAELEQWTPSEYKNRSKNIYNTLVKFFEVEK